MYLPLVGAVTGALAGTAAWGVSLAAPRALAVATAFGLSIVLTGALHVDGFLDAADGLFASVPAARRLEILKDPHHGTFAIAYFAVACAVWLAALWSIVPERLPLALAFAASAARWFAVGAAYVTPYGPGGERPPRAAHACMTVLTLALGWSYWGHAVVLITLGIPAFALAAWMRRQLGGGFPGDCYGFLIVCGEIGILAVLPLTSP